MARLPVLADTGKRHLAYSSLCWDHVLRLPGLQEYYERYGLYPHPQELCRYLQALEVQQQNSSNSTATPPPALAQEVQSSGASPRSSSCPSSTGVPAATPRPALVLRRLRKKTRLVGPTGGAAELTSSSIGAALPVESAGAASATTPDPAITLESHAAFGLPSSEPPVSHASTPPASRCPLSPPLPTTAAQWEWQVATDVLASEPAPRSPSPAVSLAPTVLDSDTESKSAPQSEHALPEANSPADEWSPLVPRQLWPTERSRSPQHRAPLYRQGGAAADSLQRLLRH